MKKMAIITSAIKSLPIIAPRFPSKLPHPARPASIIRLPAMNSPPTAPITGPTNRPAIPKKTPTRAPSRAPNSPLCGSEISRTEVATEKIERVRHRGQHHQDGDRAPADAFRGAKHHSMKERASENDNCPRKH